MNHREPPLSPAGLSKALNCLLLVLLPATATDNAFALSRIRPPGSGPELHHAGAIPYLSTVGAPPLRFRSPPPIPTPSVPLESHLPPPPRDASEDVTTLPNERPTPSDSSAASNPEINPSTGEPANFQPLLPGPIKEPQPIMRDSLTPTIRAEDFLPFFQIPGAGRASADVTLLVPVAPAAPAAPASIPPSSATYRQTP